ncbi:ABC transporter ATP-binding protein [Roseomonas sp. BN140053]|uniref:ABC transporter ATP-binding protein n=1 Tax=Roseomonas sp. BN140053 TaxID=3391898 RepID=UPI0039E934D2
MLRIEDLHVRIGRHPVVKGVSVSLEAGQCLAVLGRNGAGKTTLVRGLAGLLPARGKVLLDGQDLTALSPADRSRQIGYVAQGVTQVSAQLTTFDLLLLAQNGGRADWRATPESLRRAEAMLDLLHLHPLAQRAPGEMSGGQRQMVALALALVRQPRLLLLDEPTSALDLANQLHLLELVREHTRRTGIVTVMVLHDLNLATRYADAVAMLENGVLLHDGDTAGAMTRERLARVYGVDCHILPVQGGHTAIYPLSRLAELPRAAE